MTFRLPGALVIDSAVISNPLLDPDSVVDRVAWLAYEAQKWIPRAQTIVAAPWGDTSSSYALWISARCCGVGVETVRVAPGVPVERSRYGWHVVSEMSAEPPLPLRADRVRRFVVPMECEPPWDAVQRAVIEYSALMSFPSRE